MAGKAVMHAVQYDSYGGGVAGLKVVYLYWLLYILDYLCMFGKIFVVVEFWILIAFCIFNNSSIENKENMGRASSFQVEDTVSKLGCNITTLLRMCVCV